jgi:hypothetical protein
VDPNIVIIRSPVRNTSTSQSRSGKMLECNSGWDGFRGNVRDAKKTRHSEVLDFKDTNSADNEDHRSVSLMAANIEIDITETSGTEDDGADNINFVFISDLMDD